MDIVIDNLCTSQKIHLTSKCIPSKIQKTISWTSNFKWHYAQKPQKAILSEKGTQVVILFVENQKKKRVRSIQFPSRDRDEDG